MFVSSTTSRLRFLPALTFFFSLGFGSDSATAFGHGVARYCGFGGDRTGRNILAFAAELPDALSDRLEDSAASCTDDCSKQVKWSWTL